MTDRHTTGCGATEQTYIINGVKYIVSRNFKPLSFDSVKENVTLAKHIRRFISGNSADLTNISPHIKVTDEYVCSTAGKED